MISFLATARAFLTSITGMVVAALIVALVVQTVRVDGARFLFVHIEGWRPKAERFKAERDAVFEAAVENRVEQLAINRREQDRLDNETEEAQHDHETRRAPIADATDRFITDRGMQCSPNPDSGGTSAAAQGDSASVPAPVPASVVVDTADVRACGDLYNYALSAHLWAVGLADED